MTDSPFDDLQDLWKDTPPLEPAAIRAKLQAVNKTHKQINQFSFAAGWSCAVLISIAELLGRLDTHFLAPLIAVAAMLAAWWQYRRAKTRLQAQYAATPDRIAAFAANRARAGLWLARMLYAGLPAATLAGFGLGLALGGGPARVAGADIAILAASVAGLLGVSAFGLALARRRARDAARLDAAARDRQAEEFEQGL